jgi:hypothetical protein
MARRRLQPWPTAKVFYQSEHNTKPQRKQHNAAKRLQKEEIAADNGH